MESKGMKQFKNDKKEKQESSSKYKCYNCEEEGHVKTDCPNGKKGEEKESKFFKKKITYIA